MAVSTYYYGTPNSITGPAVSFCIFDGWTNMSDLSISAAPVRNKRALGKRLG